MKKEKSQAPGKGAKKQIKESIQKRLAKLLNTIAGELSRDKPHIDIEKESKKLAKKLAKGFVIKDAAKETTTAVEKVTPVKEVKPKSTSKANVPVKETKPTASKPAVTTKTEKKAAPTVKAPESNSVAPKAVKNGAGKTAKK